MNQKCLLSYLLFICIAVPVFGQWYDITSSGFSTSLQYFDREYGYGRFSAGIGVTTDGGISWQVHPVFDSSAFMISYHFVTKNLGYARGNHGEVARSTDKGLSWQVLDTTSQTSPSVIQFPDSVNGFITEDDSTFLKTIDGGFTWQQFSKPTSYDIQFPSVDTGYILQESNILRSINGGLSWDTVLTEYLGSNFQTHFSVPSSSVIYSTAGDNFYFLRTTNAGQTWDTLSAALGTSHNDNFGVHFPSENSGVVLGTFGFSISSYVATISKTTNGGNSFPGMSAGSSSTGAPWTNISFIHFIDDSVGFCLALSDFDDNPSWRFYKTTGKVSRDMELSKLPITLYPNPANDFIHIETVTPLPHSRIQLYGLDGKLHYEKETEMIPLNETLNIPTASLNEGMYLLKIISNEKSVSRKILIRH